MATTSGLRMRVGLIPDLGGPLLACVRDNRSMTDLPRKAAARSRDDTVPEPVDTLLATLAGAWAGRELVSYAEGRVPATTGATLRLDPQLTALETHRWPRHAACGCAWGE